MSWQASSWALRQAAVGGDCVARVILLAMADYAHPDGTGVYISIASLMAFTGKSESTVHRKVAWLEHQGLIRRGDQHLVDHIRPDRRPIVWDLAMDVPAIPVDDHLDESGHEVTDPVPDPDPVTVQRGVKMTPRSVSGVSPVRERGVTGARHGVSPMTPEPLDKPLVNQPPKAPQGGAADDGGFDRLRVLWPKKTGRPERLRALWDSAVASVGADTVLSSAKGYLRENRDVETRYLKGLKAWLSDPTCYAAMPAGGRETITPMMAGRRWLDEHEKDFGHADGPDVSVYDVACWVRSHPEVPAGLVPAGLSARFLGGESQ